MAGIWTMGELLVEIMRPEVDMALHEPGEFRGPYPSGAPAIFADTVARLGHEAGIIGGVGDDDFGRCLLDRLTADGVCCDHVARVSGKPTAVAFVTYFSDGSRKFIFHIDGTPAVMAEAGAVDSLETPDYFHVMGCSLMASDRLRAEIVDAVTRLHERGARITFDPNIRPELLRGRPVEDVVGPVLDRCAVLFPGVEELALLSGTDSVEKGIEGLFARPSLELVVLKLGADGCAVYSMGGSVQVPAIPVREVDPTGAGDSFDAGFLCGLIQGDPPEASARIAAAAGALNASDFGPMGGDISPEAIADLLGR